jgi:hypothetical protein
VPHHSLPTFSQFLAEQTLREGGKATAALGTERATAADVRAALAFVSGVVGVPEARLRQGLLGSGPLVLSGDREDAGDVDLALPDGQARERVLAAMTRAVGEPRKIGASTYSFAVPAGDKKVQVDLMFVPDLRWAKFSHHADPRSAHKSGVRNELLHAALRHSPVEGEDVRVDDEDGRAIARASRSYQLDRGAVRVFKVAPPRRDGKPGRVKAAADATPAEVRAALRELGRADRFSEDADPITDPDRFARLLFGAGTTAADLASVETILPLILARDDADEVLRDAVRGIEARRLDVPAELEKYRA